MLAYLLTFDYTFKVKAVCLQNDNTKLFNIRYSKGIFECYLHMRYTVVFLATIQNP